jgi:hypothetical protein
MLESLAIQSAAISLSLHQDADAGGRASARKSSEISLRQALRLTHFSPSSPTRFRSRRPRTDLLSAPSHRGQALRAVLEAIQGNRELAER